MASVSAESFGLQQPVHQSYQNTPEEIAESQNFVATQENNESEEPSIDIAINNVVSTFSTRCHLNLKKVALEGVNVVYRRENGMVSMKIRRPYTTASIWSSGKITCTGATSEEEAKIAGRRFCRILQRMGFRVRFSSFRVVNVLGTCVMPFPIRITHFSRDHRENASYEPELHPGVTYRIKDPKATLKIFSTGSITITAPCVANIQAAVEHIFPLVYEYRMEVEEVKHLNEDQVHAQLRMTLGKSKLQQQQRKNKIKRVRYNQSDSCSESSEEDYSSDDSKD